MSIFIYPANDKSHTQGLSYPLSMAFIVMRQLRIVEGGMVKGFKGGSLEAGSQMEASVTIEVVRYKMECGAEELIAVDKLNDVYRVNGNDMLAAINLMT